MYKRQSKNKNLFNEISNRYLDDNTFPFGLYLSPEDKISFTKEEDSPLLAYVGIPQKMRNCTESSFKLLFTNSDTKKSVEYSINKYTPNAEISFKCRECEIKLDYISSSTKKEECDIVFLGGLRELVLQSDNREVNINVETQNLLDLKPSKAIINSPHKSEPYMIRTNMKSSGKDEKYISIPAGSFLQFNLPENSLRLSAFLSATDYAKVHSKASSKLMIFDERGVILFYSEIVTKEFLPFKFDIDITNSKKLNILVDPADNSYDGDWIDLKEVEITKAKFLE